MSKPKVFGERLRLAMEESLLKVVAWHGLKVGDVRESTRVTLAQDSVSAEDNTVRVRVELEGYAPSHVTVNL